MFKLIILCIHDPLTGFPDKEMEIDMGFNESQAELRALRWLTYRPNDLVMLEPA